MKKELATMGVVELMSESSVNVSPIASTNESSRDHQETPRRSREDKEEERG